MNWVCFSPTIFQTRGFGPFSSLHPSPIITSIANGNCCVFLNLYAMLAMIHATFSTMAIIAMPVIVIAALAGSHRTMGTGAIGSPTFNNWHRRDPGRTLDYSDIDLNLDQFRHHGISFIDVIGCSHGNADLVSAGNQLIQCFHD